MAKDEVNYIMQRSSERITIRLTPDQVEALDTIVLNKDYKNRSQGLRVAIENFIEEQIIDSRSEKVTTEIPRMIMMRLDDLIIGGFVNNRQEAVREAVRDFILKIESEYIHNYEDVKKMRQRISEDLELKQVSKEMEKS
jgi:metal-responsive CopG/Arc/MetJ family transcriptional regulator